MLQSILNLKGISILEKKAQKEMVKGGNGGCDIGPPDCPCEIPPGHPCLDGGSGGGGGSTGTCFTPFGTIQVSCDDTCPDGSQPLCR